MNLSQGRREVVDFRTLDDFDCFFRLKDCLLVTTVVVIVGRFNDHGGGRCGSDWIPAGYPIAYPFPMTTMVVIGSGGFRRFFGDLSLSRPCQPVGARLPVAALADLDDIAPGDELGQGPVGGGSRSPTTVLGQGLDAGPSKALRVPVARHHHGKQSCLRRESGDAHRFAEPLEVRKFLELTARKGGASLSRSDECRVSHDVTPTAKTLARQSLGPCPGRLDRRCASSRLWLVPFA
jgi:hypothetical protein